MFKVLTIREQLRMERARNLELLNRHKQLEDALLETTIVLADEQMKNMQTEQAILELSMLMGGGGE
ncbi:MAG: hypothetical protein GX996_10855 [Firmicutes bacterium]|nr:hypothetical protein [Bacillota bacterium]